MTLKRGKPAYLLLLSCVALWLGLIVSAFFSSGQWNTTIVFANQTMLTLFEGAAILSSILSLLLGLDFLGISLRRRKPNQSLKISFPPRTPSYMQEYEIPTAKRPREKPEEFRFSGSASQKSFPDERGFETATTGAVSMAEYQDDDNKKRDTMKAFYLFGETEFNRCVHEYGYLGTSWKNKPIPDECFGCPKLIECVAPANKK